MRGIKTNPSLGLCVNIVSAPSILLKEERILIAPSIQRVITHLEFDGLPPIPVVCRVKAGFRSDGSLSVEGEADVEEDFTFLIGVCGRICLGDGRRKIGVRIASADAERGIVRFLIRDTALDAAP